MIHEKYGHGGRGFFSLDARVVENKRRLAQMAQAIVVVSENTKKDVLELIPEIDPAKIYTIYHGNSMPQRIPGQSNELALPARFLLFVGQRRAYKNFNWMLREIAEILRTEDSLFLVCAGGPAFDKEEANLMASLGIAEKMVHPNIRSDADLAELYTRAQCFIFPSSYEGFGIPVLEAFACGCPVILNNVSSLPEVGGDAVLYFKEEDDGASLRKAVLQVLNEAGVRADLVKKGAERVRQFSWQNSVEAHIKVYTNLI